VERTAELQDSEVRADLDWRVRECERKCSTDGRLGSIPQASARARQQATHEQVEGQWCENRTGTEHKGCDLARRLANGCASMPAVHAPEQSGQRGFLLVRAEAFGWPCFSITCA
jgi:hypothetical protein